MSIIERKKTEREQKKMQNYHCGSVPFVWVITKATQILLATLFLQVALGQAWLLCISHCLTDARSLAVRKQQRCSVRLL